MDKDKVEVREIEIEEVFEGEIVVDCETTCVTVIIKQNKTY